MTRQSRLFFAALSISLVGSLPIGTLNTSVADYTLKGDFFGAFKFGFAAILVEIILVRLALLLLDKFSHLKKLFKVLSAVMCIVLFFLAFKTLKAAFHMMNFQDVLPFVSMQPFYSGLALSLLNPLHLPFWAAWTAVLKGRKLLTDHPRDKYVYITAIALGTATGFTIYGFAGNFLMAVLKAQHNIINWILGCTLLLTAMVQAYKLIKSKPQASTTPNVV